MPHGGPLSIAISVPSGLQFGFAAATENICTLPRLAGTTPSVPDVGEVNAMRRESGDHTGAYTPPVGPVVTTVGVPPPAGMIQRTPPSVDAMKRPSGDHASHVGGGMVSEPAS